MRACFVHDARLIRVSDGRMFSGGQFPYRLWQRYLRHFDSLSVVTRVVNSNRVPPGWEESSGPHVEFYSAPDDYGSVLKRLRVCEKRKVIANALKNCDCVIARMSNLGWMAAKIATDSNLPWAVEVVGDPGRALWHHGSILGKLYSLKAWRDARRVIAKAPFAIYVTQTYLQSRYPTKGKSASVSDVLLDCVPEDVLLERLRRIGDPSAESPSPVRCGLIGDFYARYKGLDVALKAMQVLKARNVSLKLHVLGKGPIEPWIRRADQLGVAQLLSFDGMLPSGDAVLQWLDKNDVYIQPSMTEGLPRSLVEAMSRALPALGSNAGGIPELLEPRWLHKPGDYRKLANDLFLLSSDKALQASLAQRNFFHARSYWCSELDSYRDAFWSTFASAALHRRSSLEARRVNAPH